MKSVTKKRILHSDKEYVFMIPDGKLVIMYIETKTIPHKDDPTKVWVEPVNFINRGNGNKKISVSNFNKMKCMFIGELK